MTQVRTFRFHVKYGPAPLFDKGREQLKDLAGLSLEIPHAKHRFDERGVPMQYLTDFQPEDWELITVETAMQTGQITYMSLRRELESGEYLWIVLAAEYVITAWVSDRPGNRATNPLIVKDGPAWDAAAEGGEPPRTRAMTECHKAYARLVRAHELLTTLATLPERPNGERLAHAARSVVAGSSWAEAANEGGWASRKGLDNAITRVLRAARRKGPAADGG